MLCVMSKVTYSIAQSLLKKNLKKMNAVILDDIISTIDRYIKQNVKHVYNLQLLIAITMLKLYNTNA